MPREIVTSENREEYNKKKMAEKSGKKDVYDEPDYDKMSAEAKELALHADNTEHLYKSSHIPIVKNLQKKMKKGEYDQAKARKLWSYHADRAAQHYAKEHGSSGTPWHKMFTPEHRREAAHHFESLHREQVKDDTNFK
jgi:hypothetical protein